MAAESDTIHRRLSSIIPKGGALHYHHLSTPPTRCAALYNPPPQTPPEKTFCESHTLLVSGNLSKRAVAIFAIEIQIYTTAHLTTVFVSKADSTGYAPLLNLPKAQQSLLQSITTTFVSWIVRHRHRADRRLVLSLFARAQDQYLFPGSIENKRKHVLSDRQLVKWWCKTLDPVLREYSGDLSSSSPAIPKTNDQTAAQTTSGVLNITSHAHLIVPGHDRTETTHFFPPSHRNDLPRQRRWITVDPLRSITPYPLAGPRSQIPHFPDDPKSRFLDELDEEIANAPAHSSSQRSEANDTKRQELESPRKKRGQWRSVRNLEQFWELMAHRQECASGRLVGFLWVVFTPESQASPPISPVKIDIGHGRTVGSLVQEELGKKAEARARQLDQEERKELLQKLAQQQKQQQNMQKQRRNRPNRNPPLSGPIMPRQPRVKGHTSTNQTAFKTTTKYWHIPRHTQGQLILPQKSYDRAHDILLRLDFANLDIAAASTQKWVDEVGIIAGRGGSDWGERVEGLMVVPFDASEGSGTVRKDGGITANVLQVKRKPKPGADAAAASPVDNGATVPAVNILNPSLVRKKRPAEDERADSVVQARTSDDQSNGVNTLGAGFVRKKVKT